MARKTKVQIPMIYVGPDLPGGVLKRYTVFRGGYPPHIQELRDKSPSLCGLFVCLGELVVVCFCVLLLGCASTRSEAV